MLPRRVAGIPSGSHPGAQTAPDGLRSARCPRRDRDGPPQGRSGRQRRATADVASSAHVRRDRTVDAPMPGKSARCSPDRGSLRRHRIRRPRSPARGTRFRRAQMHVHSTPHRAATTPSLRGARRYTAGPREPCPHGRIGHPDARQSRAGQPEPAGRHTDRRSSPPQPPPMRYTDRTNQV